MNVCSRAECQTTAGCSHRGPRGEMCYFTNGQDDLIARQAAEIKYLKTLIAEALDEIQRMKLEASNERIEPAA